VVCTAAYSAGGVYSWAQYPARHLAARTDSDQMRAVSPVNDKSKRKFTRFDTRLMFDHVKKMRSHSNDGKVNEQTKPSKFILTLPIQILQRIWSSIQILVNPEQQIRPITSSQHESSQGCKHSP
jgi:hypothetical protein